MFSTDLLATGVTFAAAAATGCCFYCSRRSLDVIYDSRRCFEMSFAVSPVHVMKAPSLIAWNRVQFFGQKRI